MRIAQNPLVFIAQILGLLQDPVSWCSEPLVAASSMLHLDGPLRYVLHDLNWTPWERLNHRSTSLRVQRCAATPQAATPYWPAIKGLPAYCTVTGHGGIENMRIAQNPLVFSAQVRGHYGKCFRSDNRFLLMLPCPRLCDMLNVITYSARKLLLLGGDVEENPGPDTKQIAKHLKEIASECKEIKESRLADIEKKSDSTSALEKKVALFQEQINCMQNTIKVLESKIDDLESYSRRSNLIVYGLPKKEDETNTALETAVNKGIFEDILEGQNAQIERIHRLGKRRYDSTRPVILKLLESRSKYEILKNAFKLKGTDYSIGENFCQRIRDIRRNL